MQKRASSKASFSRDAWLEINLNAIENNYHEIKKALGKKKLMAVVKSDAYGHGASITAPLLEALGIDYFGVASIDEGIHLREAGIKKEILILSPIPNWAIARAGEWNLQFTLSNFQQLEFIKESLNKSQTKVKVQVKINTGMNRNGIKWNDSAVEMIQEVLEQKNHIELCGVYTHLACSADSSFTKVQEQRFREVISVFPKVDLGIIHSAASSHVLKNIDSDFEMFRVGLALYGLGSEGSNLQLIPSMSVLARISQTQELDEEDAVGYGLTWKTNKKCKIGLIPIGYADGLSRGLSNKIRALHKGEFIQQVGTISMDQTTFMFEDEKTIQVGETITLIGKSEDKVINLKEWADLMGTIEYETACNLRSRLPKIYVRN
jgi:alanine racemase